MQEFLDRIGRLEPEKYQQALPDDETLTMNVHVVSAQELTNEHQDTLEARTARLLGREIEMRYRVDPGLIAGATMRFGGMVIDGSLSGQLQSLNERYLIDVERDAA
jgi:ATP synthase F1 delta subunit